MPSWYPDSYYIQPKYESYPDLMLVDVAAGRLRPRRAKFWRGARDKALAGWERCGAIFHVTERPSGYECGEVTLDLADTADGTAGQAATCYPPLPEVCTEGGWAAVDIEWFSQQFRSNISAPLQAVICHELGHILGFGHGGDGVMSITHHARVPNDEECSAFQAYWGTD